MEEMFWKLILERNCEDCMQVFPLMSALRETMKKLEVPACMKTQALIIVLSNSYPCIDQEPPLTDALGDQFEDQMVH